LTSRSDERLTCEIFAVARLLTDEHHLGRRGADAENRLSSVLPKVAAAATLSVVPQRIETYGRARQSGTRLG
jgi:hypothetical protein